MDALGIVEDEVRELIRRRGLDPLHQAGEVRRLVEAAVTDYDERALLGPLPPLGPLDAARRFLFDAVAGFGVLRLKPSSAQWRSSRSGTWLSAC